jgi:hypothetical protein
MAAGAEVLRGENAMEGAGESVFDVVDELVSEGRKVAVPAAGVVHCRTKCRLSQLSNTVRD